MKRFIDFMRESETPLIDRDAVKNFKPREPAPKASFKDKLKGIGMAVVAAGVPVGASRGPDGLPVRKFRGKD